MYLTPVTILILVVIAAGWWLQARDEKRDAVASMAENARSDVQISRMLHREAEQDRRQEEQAKRRLEEEVRHLQARCERAEDVLWTLLEKAENRRKPYLALDMGLLARRMDPDTFEQLCQDAADAKADFDFLAAALNYHARPPIKVLRT